MGDFTKVVVLLVLFARDESVPLADRVMVISAALLGAALAIAFIVSFVVALFTWR